MLNKKKKLNSWQDWSKDTTLTPWPISSRHKNQRQMRSHGEKGTNPSLLHGHESHPILWKKYKYRRIVAKLSALKHVCASCTCWMKISTLMSWRRNLIHLWLSFRWLCQLEQKCKITCKIRNMNNTWFYWIQGERWGSSRMIPILHNILQLEYW